MNTEPITRLLTAPTGNTKAAKSLKYGYLTFFLHLAPARQSGYNVCPMATEGCKEACITWSGRGGMFNEKQRREGLESHPIHRGRLRKTRWFFERREEFMTRLAREVANGTAWAAKSGFKPSFRLNGTSDIRWESIPVLHEGKEYNNIMEAFPEVAFFDYTKLHNRVLLPENYSITFSLAESNLDSAVRAFKGGRNVAVVFRDKLPQTFSLGPHQLPVHCGDNNDLRFLDPENVIVGLRAKGKRGREDTSGFVHDVP